MVTNNIIIDSLKKLNISESKQQELLKNKKMSDSLNILFAKYEPNKLHYIVASKIPLELNSEENLVLIGDLIRRGVVKHEKALSAIYFYIKEGMDKISIEDYIRSFDKSDNQILNIIKTKYSNDNTKKRLSKCLNSCDELKFCEGSAINRVIDEYLKSIENKDVIDSTKEYDPRYEWLRKGEIAQIHMPDTNLLNNKVVLAEHLKRTNGKVITRFPPEPNGYLHIGHAKALNLSFNFSKMHNGEFILRYDDTNPRNEKEIYYNNILEDCIWLLGENNKSPFTKITHASDYFEEFIEFGFDLIKKDKAFVCNQTQEEMKKSREKNEDSPYRNRDIDTNISLFREMVEGKWKEGTISLRMKMDMKSKNPLMHDLVAFRVIDHPHFNTKDKFKVYPSYDFTHCINDSLEDITHSFCSREFFNRKESYYWVLEHLNLYKPVQWEFSRLNIEDTMLSKRKIIDLIERKIVQGWDDPRLYTLCGLRRRGFTAEGINKFVKSVGITFSPSLIELKALENFVREDLQIRAAKMSCVVDPLKIVIKTASNESVIIYIERSDFSTAPDKDFMRLTPSQPVGLLSYCTIKVMEYDNDKIVAILTDEKPKKFIHFVREYAEVELRFYDNLFVNGVYNENSIVVKKGYCDVNILKAKKYDLFQFLRVGFFCVDEDSCEKLMVLNLTLTLKNPTWK